MLVFASTGYVRIRPPSAISGVFRALVRAAIFSPLSMRARAPIPKNGARRELVLVVSKICATSFRAALISFGPLQAQEIRASALASNEFRMLEAELRANRQFCRVQCARAPVGRRLTRKAKVLAND